MNTAANQPSNPIIKVLLSCIKQRSNPCFCPSGQKGCHWWHHQTFGTKSLRPWLGWDWRRDYLLAWKMVWPAHGQSACVLMLIACLTCSLKQMPRKKKPPGQHRMPVSKENKQCLGLNQLSYGIGIRWGLLLCEFLVKEVACSEHTTNTFKDESPAHQSSKHNSGITSDWQPLLFFLYSPHCFYDSFIRHPWPWGIRNNHIKNDTDIIQYFLPIPQWHLLFHQNILPLSSAFLRKVWNVHMLR